MFYFDSDKIEIKGWIKSGIATLNGDFLILQSRIEKVENFQNDSDIFADVERYVRNQLAQNNAEYGAQISALKKEIENLKSKFDATASLQAEISELRTQNKLLENKIASLKSDATASLQAEISELRTQNKLLENKIANLKPDATASLQAEISELRTQNKLLENKIANLKPDATASLQAEISELRTQNKLLENKIANLKPDATDSLQAEISELRTKNKLLENKNSALEEEIKKIWLQIKKSSAEKIPVQPSPIPASTKSPTPIKPEIKPPTPIPPQAQKDSPEKIFYLPKNDKVFISDNREKILEKIQTALKVEEIQNFLLANNSETSNKFQKLVKVHLQSVQSFINKMKLDDLDDEELSETVTQKYFKVFQQIIFDNFLVAIKRGLNGSEKNFYLDLLKKTNEYLSRAGIYTVNAKSGEKVSDEDFENMTAQVIKTADKNKIGLIAEIERLPYRINYLDEFGEQKYFQYNGTMAIFKAVQ